MITQLSNYIPECTATLKLIVQTLSLSGFLGEEKEWSEDLRLSYSTGLLIVKACTHLHKELLFITMYNYVCTTRIPQMKLI